MGTQFKNLMTSLAPLDEEESVVENNLTSQFDTLVSGQKNENGDLLYPCLSQYTTPVKKAERTIVGRDVEMDRLLAAMMRPELCNVILLADAGAGKTALVQGTMLKDTGRLYLEVDLSRMIADLTDPNQLGDKLKRLFAETQAFLEANHTEIVLFMDEFHQIVQLSAAAVEALKPLLADSGTRGIRVIAATTYIEFREFIQPNQPLVERLQRINLDPPDKATVVEILKGMTKRYGIDAQFIDTRLLEQIYELTNRYVPANSQPRKSILVLDSMVGWYRYKKRKMNMRLLADVIYESEGVNIAFRVDAAKIKEELDAHVFAQEFATSVIEERLQVCVADLNNKSKPMSSFLFTGSTGVGKGLVNEEKIPVWTPDGSVYWKYNGDLEVGDYVFNRKGEPVMVTGVYHRGLQDIYKVTLSDGRFLLTDSSHLWTYMMSKGKRSMNTYTNSTLELFERGVSIDRDDGRQSYKYWIPVSQAVQYPVADLSVHPYVMGAFIGNGCMTIRSLTFSSDDEILVKRLADLLGGCSCKRGTYRNYNWTFPLDEPQGQRKLKQLFDVFGEYPEVCGKKSEEKCIPEAYMHASVEQRWELVRGLFDTDGSIGNADGGRYNVSYSSVSLQLIKDIQMLLYSLGVSSTYGVSRKATDDHIVQYTLHVKSLNEEKDRFFWLPRKLEIAEKAKLQVERLSRRKDYSWLAITSIEKLDEQQETTCIMVDDEEHLYQAGQYVVTHNTEVSKQLSRILFNDPNRLIRFDMSEYANADSLDSFRRELTDKVWARPYSIVLLDEVEKSCAPVTRLLLQVLDDGRLMDENNREVTFTNCYIILTTNAGAEVYRDMAQYNASDTGDGRHLFKYEKLIRESISSTTGDNKFPPELLGRIDCIVPFQPLSEATQQKIIGTKLQALVDDVRKKHGVELGIKRDVIDYICRDRLTTDSNEGGARAAIGRMESEVVTAVARYINQYPDRKSIVVVVDGEMAWKNKDILESTASIKVMTMQRAGVR